MTLAHTSLVARRQGSTHRPTDLLDHHSAGEGWADVLDDADAAFAISHFFPRAADRRGEDAGGGFGHSSLVGTHVLRNLRAALDFSIPRELEPSELMLTPLDPSGYDLTDSEEEEE